MPQAVGHGAEEIDFYIILMAQWLKIKSWQSIKDSHQKHKGESSLSRKSIILGLFFKKKKNKKNPKRRIYVSYSFNLRSQKKATWCQKKESLQRIQNNSESNKICFKRLACFKEQLKWPRVPYQILKSGHMHFIFYLKPCVSVQATVLSSWFVP